MPSLLGNAIRKIASTKIKFKAWRAAGAEFNQPMVSYGFDHIPGPHEVAHGGIVKFQRMQELYANSPSNYNILYLLSSFKPEHAMEMAEVSRKKGAKLVWNQNGVAFPAWHGPGWENTNAPMKALLDMADYVFYQSKFCKESADHFLGVCKGPSEILYNAVDTNVFKPTGGQTDPEELTLLLLGSHWQLYRVQAALETLHALLNKKEPARLVIAGRFCWRPDPKTAEKEVREICLKLGIMNKVIFMGPYTQIEAVHVIQQANILLHTKCNDPCPTVVLEAMACGLPVVYSCSGGVPELVGPDAGVGVKSNVTWDSYEPPQPFELAEAVLTVRKNFHLYSKSARLRALSEFDIHRWLERHRVIFSRLAENG